MLLFLRFLQFVWRDLTACTTKNFELFPSDPALNISLVPKAVHVLPDTNNNLFFPHAVVIGAYLTFKPNFMRRKLLRVGTFIGVLFLLLSISSVSLGQATVTSDADDYPPRSTAIFTGAGFEPGESVELKVKNLTQPCNTVSADSSYLPWTVQADESGGFVTEWLVCDCPGDSLRLKATGLTSGSIAYAYFTDATGDGTGTMTVTPTPVCSSSTENNFVFTYTTASGGPGNAFASGSAQIRMVVPTGWPAPQNSNSAGAGYITIQTGTATSVTVNSISGMTILLNVNMTASKSFSITYTNVTAPAFVASPPSANTYTFTTSSKSGSSGGSQPSTLTALGTSPIVTVNAPPSATISYNGNPFCTSTGGNVDVTRTGTPGGTYSSTAGLTINSNGRITPSSSTPGTYTVTYTVAAAGGCSQYQTSTEVTITAAPSATFSYTGSPYCSTVTNAAPTFSGTTGGTFTAPAGLSIDASTGAIDPSASIPNTYTVTYIVAAGGGCAQYQTTASVRITASPSATISYGGSPYCSSDGMVDVTRTGTPGGTYSGDAGLVINGNSGRVNTGTSTTGNHVVTYTVAAANGCSQYQTTANLTINATPVANLTGGTTICNGQQATLSVNVTTGTGTISGNLSDGSATLIPFSGTAPTITVNVSPTATTTYTISTLTDANCDAQPSGKTGSAIVTVNQKSADPTSATASPSTICTTGSSTLTLNGGGGGTGEVIKWYTASCGGTLVGTGNNLSVNPSSTTTYYGRYEDPAPCSYNSACAEVTVTVVAQPAPGTLTKTPNNASVCSGSDVSATLSTPGTGGAGTITDVLEYRFDETGDWLPYTGGSNLSISSHTIVEIRTYRTATGSGCTQSTASTVSWTVNPLPVATLSGDQTICNGQSATLTITPSVGTGTFTGTLSPGAISFSGSGSSFTVNVSPTTTTTYTIATLTDGNSCDAAAGGKLGSAIVTVNQKSADPTSATAGSATICNGGSTTLTLVGGGGGTGEVIKWYTGSCGGNEVGTGNGASVSPTVTTKFYGRYENGTPCNYNSACAEVTVTVVAQPTPGTLTKYPNVAEVCEGTNVKATATAGTGGAGTITDVLEYRYNGAGAWSAYTSNTNLSTTGKTQVEIRTYRTATGTGCTTSTINTVSWNVNALPVFTAPTGAGTTLADVQYSDPIASTTITVTDDGAGSDITLTSQWKLLSAATWTSGLPSALSLSAPTTGTNSKSWTLSGNVNIAPGTYQIQFSAGDASLCGNTLTLTFTVKPEDATATYNGALCVATSTATATTATVTLSATIKDITAVTGDPLYDTYAGDISKAKVKFINRTTGLDISGWLNVGLVSVSDPKTGTVIFNWPNVLYNQQYTIGIVVGGTGWYTRNSSTEDVVVNVYQPNGDFITGGGYLVLTSNSNGIKKGDENSKNNFGFNVKYNKSGTNLQGTMNIIFRRTEYGIVRTYQIKGTAMSNLSVKPVTSPSQTTPSTATFNSKANIQDITNPLLPINCDGGTLQVTLSDAGEPGKYDKIGIILYNKNGGVWFSSNWDGTKTVNQQLAGGNLVVRGGAVASSILTTTSSSSQISTVEPLGRPLYDMFAVRVLNNPSTSFFTIQVQSNTNEVVEMQVYDIRGRKVGQYRGAVGESFRVGAGLMQGTYLLEVLQGKNRSVSKLIKN